MSDPLGGGRRERYDRWMLRALEVAAGQDGELSGYPDGDVPVGAVLFGPDGGELAIGRNERVLTGDPTTHAEVVAIRAGAAAIGASAAAGAGAGAWRLTGCTLVVTLEPCTMCAGAAVLARLAVVVFGAWEPKTGAVGSLWDVVRDRRLTHRPEVYGGVREAECSALLRAFFASRRQ